MYQFSKGFRLVVPYVDRHVCVVKECWNGLKAEEVLKLWLPFLADRHVECAFETSRVQIDGIPVNPHTVLRSGRKLEHHFHRHEPEVVCNIRAAAVRI